MKLFPPILPACNPCIHPVMRQYEPIWHRLKNMPIEEATSRGVSVTANRVLHPRIIKAVVKEKWMDLGYKIQMEPRKTILMHSRKHAVLTFYLHLSVSTIDESCV